MNVYSLEPRAVQAVSDVFASRDECQSCLQNLCDGFATCSLYHMTASNLGTSKRQKHTAKTSNTTLQHSRLRLEIYKRLVKAGIRPWKPTSPKKILINRRRQCTAISKAKVLKAYLPAHPITKNPKRVWFLRAS